MVVVGRGTDQRWSMMTRAWRLFAVTLAILCVANASLLFLLDASSLSQISALLSMAAATALLISLRRPVRYFTLVVAGLSLWLQAIDMIFTGAPIMLVLQIVILTVFGLAGFASFAAWVSSLRYHWPRHWWQLPLL